MRFRQISYYLIVLMALNISVSKSFAQSDMRKSDYKKIALQDSVKPTHLDLNHIEEQEKTSKGMIELLEGTMPDHPMVTTQYIILANIYLTQKKYPEAERLYKQVINKFISEKYIGADLATIYNNLAEVYREQDINMQEAEQLYKKALAIDFKSDEIKEILQVMAAAIDCNNLATFYDKQKNYSTAESLYEQMIKLNQLWFTLAQLKEQTPEARIMTENYFAFLTKHGKATKAKQIELEIAK